MPVVRTPFTAEQHGFRFSNSFELLSGARLGGIGPVYYGLCGGMAYAALDYYHADIAVPTDELEPAFGSPLYRLLLRRQIDSMWPPSTTLRVLSWMRKDDAELAPLTVTQFGELCQQLDSGEPAVLVIVRAQPSQSATLNHQVVAVGYDLDAATGQAQIYLYDPIYPCSEPRIFIDVSNPDAGIALSESTGDVVRAFFLSRYEPQTRGL